MIDDWTCLELYTREMVQAGDGGNNEQWRDNIMNMEKDEYIQGLEKRIEKLENILEHLCVQQCKEISMTNCPIGDIKLGDNCNITLNACAVGAMIPDIDDAENRLDEVENRLDEVMADLDDVENRLNDFETDSEE